MTADEADSRFGEVQRGLLGFLRAFEAEQEQIQFRQATASQERLESVAGDFFATKAEDYFLLAPAPAAARIHEDFCHGLACCAEAYRTYMRGKGVTFNKALIESRLHLSRGLELLYRLRAELPVLKEYWFTPAALNHARTLESSPVGSGPEGLKDSPTGIMHPPASAAHAEYSLYVPESYAAEREWPLIVCLHGAHGQGREHLWTWMRPAKSAAYLLVAPNSLDFTWSILHPPRDVDSVSAILEEVGRNYRIDRQRLFLTGLSDGGTFSYLLALLRPELFAGVAPVAAELSQVADPLLRQGVGRSVPLRVIHGALDHIFPVQTVRSTCDLLARLGYEIDYDELPEWGHAYPYQINEQRLLPWFESLGGSSSINR